MGVWATWSSPLPLGPSFPHHRYSGQGSTSTPGALGWGWVGPCPCPTPQPPIESCRDGRLCQELQESSWGCGPGTAVGPCILFLGRTSALPAPMGSIPALSLV